MALPLILILVPVTLFGQSQDFRAVRIVAEAFEKAKKDDETRQSTTISTKIHKIENLNSEGDFESVEKVATFKVHLNKKGRPTEELVNIQPLGVEPAKNPVDFEKLLDAFFGRFYFLLSPEGEIIDGQKCYKIHFWPKDNLPPEKENSDYVLNRIAGVIHIDEKTYQLRAINASLIESVSEQLIFFSFSMDKFDLKVEFNEWHGMGLLKKMTVTTRYSYRKLFSTTKQYQTHEFYYEYKNK